jgi:hypothetical protein
VIKGSSASANSTPITVTFQDGAVSPNTVIAYVPYADTTYADTSFHEYVAVCPVPVGTLKAVVTLGYTHWSSVGGYSAVVASPGVFVL